jgi:NNP family nitrate/nitrite transporter-like MFS transporter
MGGTRVTFWNFVAMAFATIAVIHCVDNHQFGGFMAMFLLLFVTTGLGNGSTFRMIPVIFRNEKLKQLDGERMSVERREAAIQAARVESATVIGFVSAIGACGGYLVPRSFGASVKATGSASAALTAFVVFYATCIGLTWALYLRRRAVPRGVPSVEAPV